MIPHSIAYLRVKFWLANQGAEAFGSPGSAADVSAAD